MISSSYLTFQLLSITQYISVVVYSTCESHCELSRTTPSIPVLRTVHTFSDSERRQLLLLHTYQNMEKTTQDLDLESLCVSSETENIPESVFKTSLQSVCPWFNPHSKRPTWKECAVEYVRRMKPGAKFAPSLKLVDSVEFLSDCGSNLVLNKKAKSGLEDIDKMSEYTSCHGITMDVTHFGLDDLSDDDMYYKYDCARYNQLISLPEVLVVAPCELTNCCGYNVTVSVKFKNSQGKSPDFSVNVISCPDPPKFCHTGEHLFMIVITDGRCMTHYPQTKVYFLTDEGFEMIGWWGTQFSTTSMTLYDGLFLYLEGDQLHAVQCSNDSEVNTMDSSSVGGSLKVKSSYREDSWDPHLSVVVTSEDRCFVVDVSRDLIVPATREESGNEFTVP